MADQSIIKGNVPGGFPVAPRPLDAVISGARFLFDIENTVHFFRMLDAIDGHQNEVNYQRYIKTVVGGKLDRERVDFNDVLGDEAWMASHLAHSLAAAYLDFQKSEELDIANLMDAELASGSSSLKLDEGRRVYMKNAIAVHDIYHVLLGYGRDPVGEACVLVFSGVQFKLKGVTALAHALAVREQARFPREPILSILGEAKRIAKSASWVAEMDWRAFLPRSAQDARDFAGIDLPTMYLKHRKPASWLSIPHEIERRAA